MNPRSQRPSPHRNRAAIIRAAPATIAIASAGGASIRGTAAMRMARGASAGKSGAGKVIAIATAIAITVIATAKALAGTSPRAIGVRSAPP